MPTQLIDIIQATSSLLSVVIAFIAIVLAIRSERRAERRFIRDLEVQQKIAQANIRPILTIRFMKGVNNKGVRLTNVGLGTAVITDIVFVKNGKQEKSLRKLFGIPETFPLDSHWSFGPYNYHLPPGDSFGLIGISAERLRKERFTKNKAQNFLDNLQENILGMTIKICYEDVLGNKQDDFERTILLSSE